MTKYRRKSAVLVIVAVSMVVLIGFAAIVADVGIMYNARQDLQRTADASALAGVSALVGDEMMKVIMGTSDAGTFPAIQQNIVSRSQDIHKINPFLNGGQVVAEPEDIKYGFINIYSGTSPIDTGALPEDHNAVYVISRKEAGHTNGTMPLFFAAIFGKHSTDISASAVAAFDTRYERFIVDTPGAANVLPFTIHEDAYEQEYNYGEDNYSCEHETVSRSPDGIREIRLYPYPLSGSGYTEGDGNFGVLNIGTENQGIDAERVQIENGVSGEDFYNEIGTDELFFENEYGESITYDMTGSPGLEATLKDAIEAKIGDVIGFFTHNQVILSGSNAIYTITSLKFGRIMDIRLTGPPNQKGFYIQPVIYSGGGIKIDPERESYGRGEIGRIVLVR
jgi:hypothetical protein